MLPIAATTSREAAAPPKVWYHGDTSRRRNFNNQDMDRDHTKDPNAMGPGIYWTSDKRQAAGYAGSNGWVYEATIKTVASKLLYDDKPRPSSKDLEWLIEQSDNPDGFLTNWGFDPGYMSRKQAMKDALRAYGSSHAMIDAVLGIYHDCYGRENANAWTKNMVRMGIDAFLHRLPDVWHLIVYNPRVIKITSEHPAADLRQGTSVVRLALVDNLFHTTSLGGLRGILRDGKIKASGDPSFVSFSEIPFFGDISGSEVVLAFDRNAIKNQLIKVNYDEYWYDKHSAQASYIAGEGWREQFNLDDWIDPEDIDEDGWIEPDIEEDAWSQAELLAFMDKEGEREWVTKRENQPVKFNEGHIRVLLVVSSSNVPYVEKLVDSLGLSIPVQVLSSRRYSRL